MLIWSSKYYTFIDNASFGDLVFGVGKDRGIGLTSVLGVNHMGFHNDFLAFLVSYGVVGLCFFVALLVRPLRKLKWSSPYRTAVIANSVFLFLACMTLEPFFIGMYPLYAFLFYTLLLTKVKDETR